MQGEKLKRLGALADAAYDAMEDVGLDLINTRPTTVAGILALCQYIAPLFGETEQPNPQYIAYDDGTDAYTAEAFAHVIGRSIENMMKVEGTVQWAISSSFRQLIGRSRKAMSKSFTPKHFAI